ncbi:DNA polymerase [Caballeronia sp. TF1N1]|uniref:DNA polymerase n=1 Tax=Caballeronia sp. TF1N1 TaxID=2878153 RepID=UPI001FD4492D|nr:DNA polymerase [Caballeronia sp. TF1N1]
MRHHVWEQQPTYPVCLLVGQIQVSEIERIYFPSGSKVDKEDVMVLDLHFTGKKTPVGEMKRYINEQLQEVIDDNKCQYILVADAGYFKLLTGESKADANLGYVLDSKFGPQKVVYIPSHKTAFHDPKGCRDRVGQAMDALVGHVTGAYYKPGYGLIKFADYPDTDEEIAAWLDRILDMHVPITVDIETFSLKHYSAGIGTITLCWNQGEGIAFPVDYVPIEGATAAPFGVQVRNERRRELLRYFFEQLGERAIYHRIAFDVYVLIYQLYMKDITDTEGLLLGMKVMLRNWDCSLLVTYFATNSCAGNDLSLKTQAQAFAGNYAQDEIEDITKIPLSQLLEYNLIDGLSTWYTYDKHYPTMVSDNQLDIYESLFKPGIKDIIQMQLTGMPVYMPAVDEVATALQAVYDDVMLRLAGTNVIAKFEYRLKEKYIEKKHAEWKKKRITLAEVPDEVVFNPRSNPQMQDLLYGMLGLPVIAHTKTGLPSCDGDTIEKLRNHTKDADVLDMLAALQDHAAVDKILTSFIPALKNAQRGPDGWWYLFGNYNLGGTVSGRLSSNDPNMQNLPANVAMAISAALLAAYPVLAKFVKKGKLSLGKLIKYCFQAPPGWIFCGLDFASLEDRISALTTKDPNKLKVYTDGYDGHCLRSYAYFPEKMPDIDPNSVASINSIEVKYKDYRQDSKAPTFALTYQGTFSTLMKNCGFSLTLAMSIEAAYKSLYHVSIKWVQDKLDQAAKDGYVTAAFGLRVRTPRLAQVIRGTSKTPREAEAEGRTAGNALGQSWCLLNTRACMEFMGKVRQSQYRLDIRPVSHIHDAQYYLVREDLGALAYMNKHLVKAVQWQDHPDIWHDEVKLGGELSVFFPSWADEIGIPNGVGEEEIADILTAEPA